MLDIDMHESFPYFSIILRDCFMERPCAQGSIHTYARVLGHMQDQMTAFQRDALDSILAIPTPPLTEVGNSQLDCKVRHMRCEKAGAQ